MHFSTSDTPLAFFKNLPYLIELLEKGAGIALNWLKQNQIISYLENFIKFLLEKIKQIPVEKFKNPKQAIKSGRNSFKLLSIQLDDKLNFDQHIRYSAEKLHHNSIL